jgi:transketolase
MALRNSTNGEITRHYSIEELKDAANLMRGYDLVALNAAGSGHAGGTLSIMDITAALYLRVAEHDPGHSLWEDRDRIVWSTGHKAPSLYLGWPLRASVRSKTLYSCASCGRPTRGIGTG